VRNRLARTSKRFKDSSYQVCLQLTYDKCLSLLLRTRMLQHPVKSQAGVKPLQTVCRRHTLQAATTATHRRLLG
jgi:hypothetical protein